MAEHVEPTPEVEQGTDIVKTYMRVFWVLLVFTILEYVYAMLFQEWFLGLVVGLMTLAITKATLVGMFFMHIKWEGKWIYAMLVPAGILAMVFIFSLVPDIGMPPTAPVSNQDVDEAAAIAPAPFGTPALFRA